MLLLFLLLKEPLFGLQEFQLQQQPRAPFFGMGSGPNNNQQNMQQMPNNNLFAGMSDFPSGQNQPGQGQGPGGSQQPPFGFSQQNLNASGINDPAGSKRINIFLGRTTDRDGNPGIVGAIAPLKPAISFRKC